MTVDALSVSVDLSLPGSDMNSDGAVDILWRNTTSGLNYAWFMDGTNVSGGASVATMDPAAWQVQAVADFNSDGQSDLLWRNTIGGEVYVWYMDRGLPTGSDYVATMDTSWQIATVGDLNADSQSDILWWNQNSGDLYVWYMQDKDPTGVAHITTMSTNWRVRAVGDFGTSSSDSTADGHVDLFWADETAGNSYVWFMNNATDETVPPTPTGSVQVSDLPTSWRMSGTGDFNDDGKTDLLWWDSASGLTYVWYMNGAAPTTGEQVTQLDTSWQPLVIDRGGKADLTLANAVVPSSAVTDGESVNLAVSVYNRGSKTAPSSTNTVQFYLSDDGALDGGDTLLGSANLEFLRSGQSREASLTFTYDVGTMGSGERTVLMVVDNDQAISESDESNNLLSATMSATTPALDNDLTVQTVAAPSNIVAGTQVTVDATVANLDADAAPTSTLALYLSSDQTFDPQTDQLITSSNINELAAGASRQESFTFTYNQAWATGSQFFYVVADSDNQIEETDETNNVAFDGTTVSELALADLEIRNQQLSASWVVPGNTLTLTSQVYNIGNAAAGTNKLRFYLSNDTVLDGSDQPLGGKTITSINAETISSVQSFEFTYSTLYGLGTKYVLFVADNDNAVVESNETNNMAYAILDVRESAPQGKDLLIESRSVTPTSLTFGDSLTVNATVINEGAYTADATTIGFYVSDDALWDAQDTLVYSQSLESLTTYEVSTTKTHTFNYLESYGSGQKYILAVADHNNTVAEFDEGNNFASVPITVFTGLEKPDLTVTNLTGTTSITTSDVLTVSYDLQNIGDDIADGPFDIYYYISEDATFDVGTDTFLTYQEGLYNVYPGVTATIGLANPYSPSWGTGTQFLLVVVDPTHTVTESNEDNNVGSFEFQIVA
jgi:subtilase family serine protease